MLHFLPWCFIFYCDVALSTWWHFLSSETDADEVAKKIAACWIQRDLSKIARGRSKATGIFSVSFLCRFKKRRIILQGKDLYSLARWIFRLIIQKWKNRTRIVFLYPFRSVFFPSRCFSVSLDLASTPGSVMGNLIISTIDTHSPLLWTCAYPAVR